MKFALNTPMDDLYKFARLYTDVPLAQNASVHLPEAQAHYIRTVMRRAAGDQVRLFNGRDGEWLATLDFSGKRDVSAILQRQTKPQPARTRRLHLFFTPLKKDRMDALVEAAVQLDATDLHPVITDRTEVREVKIDKLEAHLIEASEQCERLDLPILHPLQKLDKALASADIPVFAGLERSDAVLLRDTLVPVGDCAALVGPVGGWTDTERDMLSNSKNIKAVSLGTNVLRSETAVAVMLARLAAP